MGWESRDGGPGVGEERWGARGWESRDGGPGLGGGRAEMGGQG